MPKHHHHHNNPNRKGGGRKAMLVLHKLARSLGILSRKLAEGVFGAVKVWIEPSPVPAGKER